MLSEWTKFSQNLPYTIPSHLEAISTLILNYISDPQSSIDHFTKLLDPALQTDNDEDGVHFSWHDYKDFK
jgi:hypothetical protein